MLLKRSEIDLNKMDSEEDTARIPSDRQNAREDEMPSEDTYVVEFRARCHDNMMFHYHSHNVVTSAYFG